MKLVAETGTKLAVNKIQGKLGEDIALDYLKSQGHDVSKGTFGISCGDLGYRFPDIPEWDKMGQLAHLWETKSGGAIRSPKQIAKDTYIDRTQGVGTTVIRVGIQVWNGS